MLPIYVTLAFAMAIVWLLIMPALMYGVFKEAFLTVLSIF